MLRIKIKKKNNSNMFSDSGCNAFRTTNNSSIHKKMQQQKTTWYLVALDDGDSAK